MVSSYDKSAFIHSAMLNATGVARTRNQNSVGHVVASAQYIVDVSFAGNQGQRFHGPDTDIVRRNDNAA